MQYSSDFVSEMGCFSADLKKISFFITTTMLGITDLKTGQTIEIEGEPYIVAWNQFSKTARQGGVMKTKLRNLLTGNVMEKTFQGSDKIEKADVNFRRAQFLYATGDTYEFMDQETFETVSLSKEVLGESAGFLLDGMTCDLQYFNDQPINIQLPPKMTFQVVEAEPGVQGDRSQGGTKSAKIETGMNIQVPLFVSKGDKVVLNTETGEYVERAKN
ncbi:elongation factor P [Candidatus Gracilibacteria bacterium]|nr:elongation factor P [Candidatus Gracilibacteria bacterium]MCF7819078.1 elongation factor P [Candidatus Gracilibacteria bacterium]